MDTDGNFTVGRTPGVQNFTYPLPGPMLRGAAHPLPGGRQAGVTQRQTQYPDPESIRGAIPASPGNDAYTVRGAAAHLHPLTPVALAVAGIAFLGLLVRLSR